LVSRLMERLDTAGSTLFIETWKRRRTPLGLRYWAHTARALPTSVSASISSVPTLQARLNGGGDYTDPEKALLRLEAGHQINLSDLATLAAVPTPQTHDVTTRGNTEADGHYYPHDLSNAAVLSAVPTPNTMDNLPAKDYDRLYPDKSRTALRNGNLREVVTVASVPIPMAGSPATETYSAAGNNDYSRRIVQLATRATPRTKCAGAHRGTPDTLHSQANLATVTSPSARDWKDTSGMSEAGVDPDGSTRSRLDQLPRQAQLADSGLTATGGTDGTKSTGQLDPAYSRWLMGVPPEWDGFAYTAMQSVSQQRKRSSKAISKRKDND
jgi:hypothetical protein